MSRTARALGLCLAVSLAAPLAAETLPVKGLHGARADIPAEIEIIAVEPFDGAWGYELREALSDILSAPVDGYAPFFQVVPDSLAATGDYRPDAALRGMAHAWVADQPTSPRIRRECAERDAKDKCVRRREIYIPCREMRVGYDARATLIGRDGERLYDGADHLQAQRSYCLDDYIEPDPDAMIEELAQRHAASLVGEFAPRRIASTPRLLEQRKGLSKRDRRAFKRALKLTKSDPAAACQAFTSLEPGNPDHVSIVFNIGLCHESAGQLAEAERYYHRAIDVEPGKGYPYDGLARIASHRRGAAQLAARGRSLPTD